MTEENRPEVLVHLFEIGYLENVRAYGLRPRKYSRLYFHRIRPIRGSHTLEYLRRYSKVSGLALAIVNPNNLDQDKLLKTRYEATYEGEVPPELVEISTE